MDHVNKTLHLSLWQDIKIITETLETIEIHSDVKSWIFPTKDFKFVKEFIVANGIFEYGTTELYLELLLDRLYFGLRSILNNLEEVGNCVRVKDIFIQQPKQITFGCCFLRIWKIVAVIVEKMEDKNNQSTDYPRNFVNTKNSKTQTDIVSLDKCDSCASAITCMKSLLNIFDEFDSNDTIKRKIKPRIFDITQFGSMFQTAISVETSLKTIIEKLLTKIKENYKLQEEMMRLENETKNKEGNICFLEQEVNVYKEQCRKNTLLLASLTKQQQEFTIRNSENDKERQKLEEMIMKLKESSRLDAIKIESLRNANQKISDFFKVSLQFQSNMMNQITSLQKTIETIENEQECISGIFFQFEKTIDDLNNKLINISNCHNATEYKLKKLGGDWLENIPNLIAKFKEFKENVNERMIEASINNSENTQIPRIQIKGNPLEDITKQMAENNDRIRQLTEENSKLQTIIKKFKQRKK